MDKPTVFVLAMLALATWLAAAIWNEAAPRAPRAWREWMRAPGRGLTLMLIAGATIALSIGMYGQFQDAGSPWREWSVELISVSFAVLVIDYANRRRAAIEFKQSIIRQMASRSNDFALDAARVVVDRGWHKDGSLKAVRLLGANLKDAYLSFAHLEGADLEFANLEGANLAGANLEGANLLGVHLEDANLWDAHLEDANLWDAHLEGANLWFAYLEGADLLETTYDAKTKWPDGYDPVAAGAILVDTPEEWADDEA